MALSDTIVDVSDPAASGLTGLSGLIEGSGGFGAANATRLQAILDACIVNNANTARGVIYFPTGLWQIGAQVIWPNFNSFRVIGGGGMCKSSGQMSAKSGSCTYIMWTGGATGPMFWVRDTSGDVWENINFDGQHGPETNAGGAGLDNLILHNRQSGTSGALYHHYKNCTFFRAQNLFYAAGGVSGSGTAEFTFSKCLFNCGETELTRWTSMAYRSDNPQSVNVLFDSNCEFNDCGYCVFLENTGRCWLQAPTVTKCGTLLYRSGGSQNINGDRIDYCHIDGGTGAEGRKALYKSANSVSTMGTVVIETPKYGTVDPDTDEFASIASFSGTTLTLTHPIRMRVGDKVAFFEADDLQNANGNKKETTIFSRSSDTLYATTDSAASLAFSGSITADWVCANGEALITCVSSDFVHLRNATLTPQHIWGGRLARLTASSHSGGRLPTLHVDNCMSLWEVDFNEAGLESLLTMSGTCFWRFENANHISLGVAPITVGNFGVFDGGGGDGDTLIVTGEEKQVIREYAQSGVEMVTLRSPSTGLPVTGLSFAAGDVKWYKDGVSQGNTTNLPAAVADGVYAITLTAAERTSQQSIIKIADQTVPAAWIPYTISIDSYGHASARHKANLNETNLKANIKAVDDDADAAPRLKRAAGSMFLVTVGSGSTVTNIVTSSIDPTVSQIDSLKNRILIFARDTTTAALRGKTVDITGSTAGGQISISPALPTPPVSGDLAIAT